MFKRKGRRHKRLKSKRTYNHIQKIIDLEWRIMGKPARVLIADDNMEYAYLLSECLRICPDIEIAGTVLNGSDAYSKLKELKPDVVLLDVIMPDIDGIEILRRLHEEDGKKPFLIMLSALCIPSTIVQALQLGASCYFVKPVDCQTIIEEILTVTGKKTPLPDEGLKDDDPNLQKKIMERINAYLLAFKIPSHLQGFQYLKDMIFLYLQQSENTRANDRALAGRIATMHNTSCTLVYQSVRYVIGLIFGIILRPTRKK